MYVHTSPSQIPHGIELQMVPSGISSGSGHVPSGRQRPTSLQSLSLVHSQGTAFEISLNIQNPSGESSLEFE